MVQIGTVELLMRYPVKSMRGESVQSSIVTNNGLLGDRTYALIEQTSKKIVSAKNPKKWPDIFFYSAKYLSEPTLNNIAEIEITLTNGDSCNSANREINTILSSCLKHEVVLSSNVPQKVQLEECFADLEEIEQKNSVIDADMPKGTFFDLGKIHLLTTASLETFENITPESDFHINRFRPNILIRTKEDSSGFIENSWIGKEIAIGDEVILKITQACPRCVMTTLEQNEFSKDLNILKTIIKHNSGNSGIYADVIHTGTIKLGDTIRII